MPSGFVIEGARELERNLATLGARLQKKVVRQAVRSAQGPLFKAAKVNAASRVGGNMGTLLARHVIRRAARRQRPGTYAVHVQLRSGVPEFLHTSERTGKVSYIPAAIEYGHGIYKEGAARPFMRPAADNTQNESKRILGRDLRTGILREAIPGRYA